jgi:hypothetical protein
MGTGILHGAHSAARKAKAKYSGLSTPLRSGRGDVNCDGLNRSREIVLLPARTRFDHKAQFA